jgi:hypothetical protein
MYSCAGGARYSTEMIRSPKSPDFGASQETLRQAQDNALYSDIICNANMRVGAIRQSCEFSEVDQ